MSQEQEKQDDKLRQEIDEDCKHDLNLMKMCAVPPLSQDDLQSVPLSKRKIMDAHQRRPCHVDMQGPWIDSGNLQRIQYPQFSRSHDSMGSPGLSLPNPDMATFFVHGSPPNYPVFPAPLFRNLNYSIGFENDQVYHPILSQHAPHLRQQMMGHPFYRTLRHPPFPPNSHHFMMNRPGFAGIDNRGSEGITHNDKFSNEPSGSISRRKIARDKLISKLRYLGPFRQDGGAFDRIRVWISKDDIFYYDCICGARKPCKNLYFDLIF